MHEADISYIVPSHSFISILNALVDILGTSSFTMNTTHQLNLIIRHIYLSTDVSSGYTLTLSLENNLCKEL
jgi:hypothetical protein